jgi:capsule polysaccharide export protein KpsE/RkpR
MKGRIAPMSDNLLQTLQHLIQDVIAPDVRELKVRVASLEKQMDVRFNAVDGRFDSIENRFKSLDEKNEAQFKALMAAIGESKAQSELTSLKVIAALSERVAVLEAQRQ